MERSCTRIPRLRESHRQASKQLAGKGAGPGLKGQVRPDSSQFEAIALSRPPFSPLYHHPISAFSSLCPP